MEDTNPELEQFRQQWRAEVSARTQNDTNKGSKTSKATRRPPPIASLSSSNVQHPPKIEEDEENHTPRVFADYDGAADIEAHGESSKTVDKEPQSALEHYEKAVERENQGNLGDSLNLYRKAFRVST